MSAALLLLSAALTLQELPVEEVTVEKKVALEESLQEIAQLSQLLETLGDPTKPEPNEDTQPHFQRAIRILKTRAWLLIKLGATYEEALKEKYALEAQLEEYRVWVKATNSQEEFRREGYEQELKALQGKLLDLQQEATVVAALYKQKLDDKLLQLETQGGPADEIAAVKAELTVYADVASRASQVFKREQIEAKHKGAALNDLKEQLMLLAGKVRDTQFEEQYLQQNVLEEFADIRRIINASHQQAIENATQTLQEVQFLEDQAAQVAVLSKYMQDILKDIDHRSYSVVAPRLLKRFEDEPELQKAIQKIRGKDFPVTPQNLNDLLNFRGAAPVPPPAETKPAHPPATEAKAVE